MGGCQNYGPFLGPSIMRHLVFRGPKGDHNFDNHPYTQKNTSCSPYFRSCSRGTRSRVNPARVSQYLPSKNWLPVSTTIFVWELYELATDFMSASFLQVLRELVLLERTNKANVRWAPLQSALPVMHLSWT